MLFGFASDSVFVKLNQNKTNTDGNAVNKQKLTSVPLHMKWTERIRRENGGKSALFVGNRSYFDDNRLSVPMICPA